MSIWWSYALNIRTLDSEGIAPRNVESQHDFSSFVSVVINEDRVYQRVDDSLLVFNIIYIAALERCEPVHDTLLRQERLFHFLSCYLSFDIQAFLFQFLKSLFRGGGNDSLFDC